MNKPSCKGEANWIAVRYEMTVPYRNGVGIVRFTKKQAARARRRFMKRIPQEVNNERLWP